MNLSPQASGRAATGEGASAKPQGQLNHLVVVVFHRNLATASFATTPIQTKGFLLNLLKTVLLNWVIRNSFSSFDQTDIVITSKKQAIIISRSNKLVRFLIQPKNLARFGVVSNRLEQLLLVKNRHGPTPTSFVYFHSFQTQTLQKKLQASA